MILRTYNDILSLDTFEDRREYLKLKGNVGEDTFGFDRYFNQRFYKSREWHDIRNEVIVRDMGCDLGISDREIVGKVLIHHMNPVSLDDILKASNFLLDPNYLICVSHDTHNYIHFGRVHPEQTLPKERYKNDMCPWKY